MKYDKKGKKFLLNAGILAAIIVFLAVYFTINSLWSFGTAVVLIMLAAVGGFHYWVFHSFFKRK